MNIKNVAYQSSILYLAESSDKIWSIDSLTDHQLSLLFNLSFGILVKPDLAKIFDFGQIRKYLEKFRGFN